MSSDRDKLATLQQRAFDLRIDNLTAITAAGSGHPGGTLSAMDLLQSFFRNNPPIWLSLLGLVVITAGCLALGARAVSRREYVLEQ